MVRNSINHVRSNAESTNSAVKMTSAEKLRTKSFDAHMNEALAKVLAYNLRVISREVPMSGIDLHLQSEVTQLTDCIWEVLEMRIDGRLVTCP